jgi:hypothetical protein
LKFLIRISMINDYTIEAEKWIQKVEK